MKLFLIALMLLHLIFCSEEEKICSICYDQLSIEETLSIVGRMRSYFIRVPVGPKILRTQCGHDFHTKCLTKWKKVNDICPDCKTRNPHVLTQNEKNNQLKESAAKGEVFKSKIMISQGADVNTRDRSHRTPLLIATVKKNDAVVEALLENGNTNINAVDDEGFTSLHYAAQSGNRRIVEALVRNTAFLEARAKNGTNPLMLAALNGHVEIVEVLLSNGANINAQDDKKWTPLIYATSERQMDVVRFLQEKDAYVDDDTSALIEAAIETLEKRLKEGQEKRLKEDQEKRLKEKRLKEDQEKRLKETIALAARNSSKFQMLGTENYLSKFNYLN